MERPLDAMTERLRKLRPLPNVDKSAIESRERLKRIMELVGMSPPPVEETQEAEPSAMVTLKELSEVTGLRKDQLYGDLRRHQLPYVVRRNRLNGGKIETAISPSVVPALLEARLVRDHNGGFKRMVSDIAS